MQLTILFILIHLLIHCLLLTITFSSRAIFTSIFVYLFVFLFVCLIGWLSIGSYVSKNVFCLFVFLHSLKWWGRTFHFGGWMRFECPHNAFSSMCPITFREGTVHDGREWHWNTLHHPVLYLYESRFKLMKSLKYFEMTSFIVKCECMA